jgi:hypothetical protein
VEQKLKQLGNSYPIEMELRYKAVNPTTLAGTGKTVEISSTSVVFTSDGFIKPGTFIELWMAWPVLLNDSVALQLVSQVQVTGGIGQALTARIRKYHFRTRAAAGLQKPAGAVVELPVSRAIHLKPSLVMCAHG